MYEQFYGLRENPFALAPNPAYLYLSRHHQYALTMLEYAIWQAAGFAVITGEVGCGKTTIVQHFLGDKRKLSIALLSNVHPGMGPLLPWVLDSLGAESGESRAHELHRRLVTFLKQKHAAGERAVLVIDEAQNLSVEALEELRVLSNVNAGRDLVLQIVLIGQPELRATLSLPGMRQFAQRIVVDYHLTPLRRDETQAYVAHRLAVAGGSRDLISTDAVERVHECAGGVPRLVNILCDTALVYGFAEQRPVVDAELVEMVLADKAGGVLPIKTARRVAADSVIRG
jgi:general secretion pathway protein A